MQYYTVQHKHLTFCVKQLTVAIRFPFFSPGCSRAIPIHMVIFLASKPVRSFHSWIYVAWIAGDSEKSVDEMFKKQEGFVCFIFYTVIIELGFLLSNLNATELNWNFDFLLNHQAKKFFSFDSFWQSKLFLFHFSMLVENLFPNKRVSLHAILYYFKLALKLSG